MYRSGDQVGHHSSHYQNPPGSNLQFNPHYSINMPYYPYTPIPTTSKGYRSTMAATHTASLTDIPSAADQGTPLPRSMGDTTVSQSSFQRRFPRNPTTPEGEERRELTFVPHEAPLALRRPSSTPNVSSMNSQCYEFLLI